MSKLTVNSVINKLREARGNIAAAAIGLRVARSSLYRFMQDNPELKEIVEEEREAMLDAAEAVLYGKVLEGSTPELIFYMKTQGHKRGYNEKNQTTNFNVDLSQLSTEQLERLANGEELLSVLRS